MPLLLFASVYLMTLPTAHCQLLFADCPLPTAHCQLPTFNIPLTGKPLVRNWQL